MGFALTFTAGFMIALKTDTTADSLYYLAACAIFAVGLSKLTDRR
jgi:hypothetical protein